MAGRDTIRQRIALEGGDAIQEALKSLGEAGEKAFLAIKDAAEKAGAAKPLERLSTTISIIKDRMRDLGVAARRVQNDLRAFGRSLNTLGGAFTKVVRNVGLLTVAVGAAAAGFFRFVTAGTQAVDEIGKQAQALGLAIDEYQRLKFALGQAGVSTQEFATAMGIFNKALNKTTEEGLESARDRAAELGITVRRYGSSVENAADSTKTGATAFAKLGVRVRDASGNLRNSEEIILDLADAFQKMPDGAEKSALAMELFGAKAGARLVPFLNAGREGAEALFKEFQRLGLGFTEADFRMGEALNDALDQLNEVRKALGGQLALIFAPDLTRAAGALSSFIAENATAIKAFVRELADRAVPVVKDFINAIIGNDAAVQNPWVLEWRDAIVSFGNAVVAAVTGIIIPAFNALLAVFDLVANGINAVFGTDFDGRTVAIATAILGLLGVFNLLFAAIGTVASGVSLLISGWALLKGTLLFASGLFSALIEGAILFGTMIVGLVGWPALLVAALAAAAVAIALNWDEITAAGERATENARAQAAEFAASFQRGWEAIGEGAGTAFDALTARSEQATNDARAQALALADAFGPAWEGIAAGASGAIDVVVGIFTAGVQTIGAVWQGISDTVTSIWDGTAAAIGAAAQGITDAIASAAEIAGDTAGVAQIADALVQPFRDAAVAIGELWDGVTSLAQTGFDGLLSSADGAIAGIGRVAQQITSKLRSELDALISTLESAMKRIISAIDRAISRLKAAAAKAKSSGGSDEGGKGLAHGGYVWGPGTSTSDSIPAMLSRGEYVINARAVRKLGLQFLRLMNSGRLAGKQIKGAIPGFAQGGLVGGLDAESFVQGITSLLGGNVLAPQLAIAGGGSIAPQRSLRPINLQLPGGESFEMLADETVAEKIQRFATGAALRTAGRKPGWAR